MLPTNTFLIRQNERIISEGAFISILSPQLLNFLDKSFFERTVFINSSPGGGKSTLLKTFSPEVLLELKENNAKEIYRATFEMLKEWDVVDENRVKLVSVKIECARENYGLIDDLYDNGKAIAVFFELLSLRILRRTLLGVLLCNQLEKKDLNRITFHNIPVGWELLLQKYPDGKTIYQWALEQEHELCNSIEEMNNDIAVSMNYNNLSVLNLISNGNVLLSGQPVEQKVLVMFDDVHALSNKQRDVLRKMIFELRPNVGIWLSQRLAALSAKDIFGTEGQIHREYEIINIDERIQSDKKSFYKALKDVSDRRVAITYKDERLEDKLEKVFSKKAAEKLEGFLEKIIFYVEKQCKNTENFTNLYDYLYSREFASTWECLTYWQVLSILIERERQKSQLVLPFIPIYTVEKFLEEYSKLKKPAEFLLCYRYKLPVYYGMDVLCRLSSGNVEQFLDFAGRIFELRIALDYIPGKRNTTLISLEEQEFVIMKCVEEKWNDITRTYTMGRQIQKFIDGIASLGIEHLKRNTVSYSGGTYTGFGIKKSELDGLLYKDEKNVLIRMLKICVVNNLLVCQEIKQGLVGTLHKVFYLNRWLCVKYKLPLGYGGWKPLSLEDAVKLIEGEN